MVEILTADQMRQAERAAIASSQTTGLTLMETAGQSVVDAIFETWPEFAAKPGHARIWCGPGNNGGDGFVVARLLQARGWSLDVRFFGDAEKLPPDARTNHDRWLETGTITPLKSPSDTHPDLEIDALFGTGLARPIDDPWLWEVLWSMDDAIDADAMRLAGMSGPLRPPRTVAIDIPSGVSADTGHVIGGMPDHGCRAPRVMLTVTFHRAKLGHYLADGPEHCGQLVIKDIGIEASFGQKHPKNQHPTKLVSYDTANQLAKFSGHKFDHGHALIITGTQGKTGAARLAARGTLRIGAGLVTLGVPQDATAEVAAQITALMMTRLDAAAELSNLLTDKRINALCIGPGCGVERAATLLPTFLKSARPVVLDADALTALARDPQTLMPLLHDQCILTPHEGEFSRLFPTIAQQLKDQSINKVEAVKAAAKTARCVVLLKGPDTVIADAQGRTVLNSAHYTRHAPWLATAGSGDVLAGFITGCLARNEPPFEAAALGAWVHVECACSFGPGLIAEDLPEVLPKVLAQHTG